MRWQTTRYSIDLSRPKIMGIVNLTPDSFSDGGRWSSGGSAQAHCERLLDQGADILDLGAESSRPGAHSVDAQEEWARLEPVLRHAVSLGVPVSVDTVKPDVMRRSLDLGVDIINDIRALTQPGAEAVVAQHGRCGVCLMHMQGTPATMQETPAYSVDVVLQVRDFLSARLAKLIALGVDPTRVVLDPGVGFGKTVEHNFELLARQRELLTVGPALLVGWSRKSSLGVVTGRAVTEREPASLAAALAAVLMGARVVRVHDVAALKDALIVWQHAGLLDGTLGPPPESASASASVSAA